MTAKRTFTQCFAGSPLILTEGAIGLRLEHEFGIKPDVHVRYASLIYDDYAHGALERLYGQYMDVARRCGLPIILWANTRRASRDNVERSAFRNRPIMGDYVRFLRGLIARHGCEGYVGGMMGCKGDAYTGEGRLSQNEAEQYHAWQVTQFGACKPDLLYAAIMPSSDEAAGMARAMGALDGVPCIVSLFVGSEGRLPDGATLNDAIAHIDAAAPVKPLCYMSNCVHPRALRSALAQPFNDTPLVRERFRGLQANASDLGAAALDGSAALSTSPPDEWADSFCALLHSFPLKICGGCCGTDDRHIEALARRLAGL